MPDNSTMKLVSSFVLGILLAGVPLLIYARDVSRPTAAPQPEAPVRAANTAEEQNKLASYACKPQADAAKGQVLICTNPDASVTFVCTSTNESPPFLEYFC